jgi:hypothetical protein
MPFGVQVWIKGGCRPSVAVLSGIGTHGAHAVPLAEAFLGPWLNVRRCEVRDWNPWEVWGKVTRAVRGESRSRPFLAAGMAAARRQAGSAVGVRQSGLATA